LLPHLNWFGKAGTLEIVSKQKCGLVTATNAAQHPHLVTQIHTDLIRK